MEKCLSGKCLHQILSEPMRKSNVECNVLFDGKKTGKPYKIEQTDTGILQCTIDT